MLGSHREPRWCFWLNGAHFDRECRRASGKAPGKECTGRRLEAFRGLGRPRARRLGEVTTF